MMNSQKIQELISEAKKQEFASQSWLDCESDIISANFHWERASQAWVMAMTEILVALHSEKS
jgi:hypothetical protein